jgi:hypothetical protein
VIMEIIATIAAGIFAGAAAYVNLVEQPARLSCGTQLAIMQWRPSYKRGTLMQAPLALIGSLSALISWWLSREQAWLIGGLLLFAVIPFTLIAILPTNRKLQDKNLDVSSAEAERLLQRWGRLHAVRSILGALAFVIFLLASNTDKQAWNWHNAFAPPTWSNWALVLIGTLGIGAAIRSLDVLRVQTDATKASADAAVSAERAWIMVDLDKVPGVGAIIDGATREGSGPQHYSTSVRVRCVCSNQGKTPAKIIEKKATALLVTGNKPLSIEPDLHIEIQDPVPEYLQTRDESKRDWTLEVDGRQEDGDMLIIYGIIRYTHLFSSTEAHTTFGFRVTINNTFQRLTGYAKYNENT